MNNWQWNHKEQTVSIRECLWLPQKTLWFNISKSPVGEKPCVTATINDSTNPQQSDGFAIQFSKSSSLTQASVTTWIRWQELTVVNLEKHSIDNQCLGVPYPKIGPFMFDKSSSSYSENTVVVFVCKYRSSSWIFHLQDCLLSFICG